MPETRDQILDLAERAIRLRGYHAVSFRDIADELGIKSASIHYHFRHKEDLGVAMVERYAKRVHTYVGDAGILDWPAAVGQFGAVYKRALHDEDLQCLCGMLAAESAGLPDPVAAKVAEFFKTNLAWLKASMPEGVENQTLLAQRVQAEIQGAMTLSVSLGRPEILNDTVERLMAAAHSEFA
ncbi:TetR/AcrR family transcriptional regulator [Roseovarius rhodophyticola]|uniref:TetR/AcrR family transcriptional regulator n=1 Tax=Roseovarius rhodophyticola TaxID=3080827 RepID=A0ABZ2TI94_9RHOB|nr:TetR/AcrR family transcriptional regulator [Roseovarius sp. W115]MDV2929754.1 TetR/AcrR family transcriptional regulator [Roseovarius sp. W115]